MKLSCDSSDWKNYLYISISFFVSLFFPGYKQINRTLANAWFSSAYCWIPSGFCRIIFDLKRSFVSVSVGKRCSVYQRDFVSELKTDYVKSFYIPQHFLMQKDHYLSLLMEPLGSGGLAV